MKEKVRFTFPSVRGQALQARKWIPGTAPKGIVQLVHGMAEHIDRYDGVAEALNRAGYVAAGHNHLGHGEGTVLRGYFGDDEGWQALIDDVHGLRKLLEKEFPGLPYFLLGHSMGSFVVRCYLTGHSDGLAGCVLSGTGYYAPSLVNAGLALAGVECLAGKKRKESPLINAVAFSSSNKPFAPNRTEFDWLSRDEQEVDRYITDPWCGFLFTAAGYRELFRGLKRLTHEEELKKIRTGLPVLLISGEKDPVGAMGEGVRKVAEGFRNAGLRKVTIRLYPECRHELFNELNREEVYADLVAWLNENREIRSFPENME